MKLSRMKSAAMGAMLSTGLLAWSPLSHATIVEVQTSLGNFKVNLFDETTPKTVENFLNYVNSSSYQSTVIHRSVPGFIIQGGGFVFEGELPLVDADSNAAVVNEPVYSNVRGTISMAKLGGQPNSATNQWFINLSDNSANLDVTNGGYTVFGQVMGDGMTIIEELAELPQFPYAKPFDELPLANFTTDDFTNGVDPGSNNLMVVHDIQVFDSATDTAATLTLAKNTLVSGGNSGGNSGGGSGGDTGSSSGGGSLGWMLAGLVALAGLRRRFVR